MPNSKNNNFTTPAGDEAGAPPTIAKPVTVEAPKLSSDAFPPTFTEKPRIVPNETGTLVTMRFKVRAKPKAEMQWFKGTQKIKEGNKFAVKYVDLGQDIYEIMLEISVSRILSTSSTYLEVRNRNFS